MWPFGSKKESPAPPSPPPPEPARRSSTDWLTESAAYVWSIPWPTDAWIPRPAIVGFVLGASSYAGGRAIRQRYWVRLKSADYVTPDMYGRWLKGRVTAVGDSDGFRLYHTPGLFWNIFKFRKVPENARGQTISIRLAGIDAPEGGHFAGQESQKYYEESLKWLIDKIKDKTVYCKPLQKDQYGRLVSVVHPTPPWRQSSFFSQDTISEQMLSAGWAHVYTLSNAVYAGSNDPKADKEKFLQLQAEAQVKRKGIWENPREQLEHPSEYKKRFAAAAGIPEAAISASPESLESRSSGKAKATSGKKPVSKS